jgi:hypothetical protein
MKRFLSILFFLVTLSSGTSAVSFKEVPELEKFFKDRGVTGTFVLFDFATPTFEQQKKELGLSDRADIQTMGDLFDVEEGRKP